MNQTSNVGAIMKMGKNRVVKNEGLLYGVMVVLLFIFQELAGKTGRVIADLLPYVRFDPYKAFAWVSVHHITEMLITLAVIMILSKLLKVDFGFGLGDSKKGIKYIVVYTAIFAGVTLVCHILMLINNMMPVYDFPLN